MVKDRALAGARDAVLENLDAIRVALDSCVQEGMIDTDNAYYNQILDLIDETTVLKSWDELEEVIAKAKTLEADVAGWLSYHGRTSVSLPWPKKF